MHYSQNKNGFSVYFIDNPIVLVYNFTNIFIAVFGDDAAHQGERYNFLNGGNYLFDENCGVVRGIVSNIIT